MRAAFSPLPTQVQAILLLVTVLVRTLAFKRSGDCGLASYDSMLSVSDRPSATRTC